MALARARQPSNASGGMRPVVALTICACTLVSARASAQDGVRREETPAPPAKTPTLTKSPAVIEAVAPEYPPEAASALEHRQARASTRKHTQAHASTRKYRLGHASTRNNTQAHANT